jgi:hypothetical protein
MVVNGLTAVPLYYSRNSSQFVNDHLTLFLAHIISSTLKMEATCSSETSVYNKPTRCHIPEDVLLHQIRLLLKYADRHCL